MIRTVCEITAALGFAGIGQLIAQAGGDGTAAWGSSILQLGGVGGVLIWFMFRSEPRMRAIEASIDRLSRSIVVLVISLPTANDAAKTQAAGIIKEIDDNTNANAK